jgi:hypothetical protein
MLELRDAPPSSARVLGEPSERHLAMIANAEAAIAKPLVGVRTSSGVIDGLYRLAPTGISTEQLVASAIAFSSALNADERAVARFPLETDAWRRWSNIHRFLMRHGICLEDLAEAPRVAALALVEASLSPTGYEAIRSVMKINETIAEITGRTDQWGNSEFGEWLYWLSIMGSPGDGEPWGFQVDGHHLNLNCVLVGDQLVASPFFLGSEPLVAESGKYAGTRVLEAEERLARQLMASLDSTQRAQAVLSATMPPGLFTGAFADNVELDYAGICAAELDADQRDTLLALIGAYVGRLSTAHAALKMDSVREHLDATYFAWMGETAPDSVFYYRVQSPVVLVEFDHEPGIVFKGTEPMRSHAHSILRTPNGNDYGADLLRQHRQRVEHKGSAL